MSCRPRRRGRRTLRRQLADLAELTLAAVAIAMIVLLSRDSHAQTQVSPPPARSRDTATQIASRFAAVDVFVDPKGSPLAAYQLEFVADPSRVKLVGVEGGAVDAFRQPPYYDPAALMHNRVILAALNPGDAEKLPAHRARIARLHLEIAGDASAPRPEFSAKLIVAASPDEKPIPAATVSVAESEGVDR